MTAVKHKERWSLSSSTGLDVSTVRRSRLIYANTQPISNPDVLSPMAKFRRAVSFCRSTFINIPMNCVVPTVRLWNFVSQQRTCSKRTRLNATLRPRRSCSRTTAIRGLSSSTAFAGCPKPTESFSETFPSRTSTAWLVGYGNASPTRTSRFVLTLSA